MRLTCFITLFLCYFTDWVLVQCRQYDVEAEAMKLYGEDLNKVLKMFRRTPEYMAILETRMIKIISELGTVTDQVKHVYGRNMLAKSINETLWKEEAGDDNPTTPKAKPRFRSGPFFDSPHLTIDQKFLMRAVLEDEGNTTFYENVTTQSPVELLDEVIASQPFSAAERNAFRDVGYEAAGLTIHKLIASMGDVIDEEERSTRMPWGEGKKDTTKHAEKHTITTPKAKIVRADDVHGGTYTFRMGKKAKGRYTFLMDKTGNGSNALRMGKITKKPESTIPFFAFGP